MSGLQQILSNYSLIKQIEEKLAHDIRELIIKQGTEEMYKACGS